MKTLIVIGHGTPSQDLVREAPKTPAARALAYDRGYPLDDAAPEVWAAVVEYVDDAATLSALEAALGHDPAIVTYERVPQDSAALARYRRATDHDWNAHRADGEWCGADESKVAAMVLAGPGGYVRYVRDEPHHVPSGLRCCDTGATLEGTISGELIVANEHSYCNMVPVICRDETWYPVSMAESTHTVVLT